MGTSTAILGIVPCGCAVVARGATRRLRMSVTMHPTALHHMVVSSRPSMPTCFFPWKPNAGAHLLLEAGAERTL